MTFTRHQDSHKSARSYMAVVQLVGFIVRTEEGETDHQQGWPIGGRSGDGEVIPATQVGK